MSALADDGSIGVYDLKTHLSSVLEEVLAGREVTVTRHGHPIARIAPVSVTTRERRLQALERIREIRRSAIHSPGEPSVVEMIREGREERSAWI